MKRIIFALLCLFAAGSAVAQTYACQFIQSAGMVKEQAGWKVAGFKAPEPFFLTMIDGVIDTKSVVEMPLDMYGPETKCSRTSLEVPGVGRTHWCEDAWKYISFSEKTMNGAYAYIFGALQSSNDKETDSITVSRFKCQKVR